MRRLLPFLLAAVVLAPVSVAARPPIWTVQGPHGKIVLFGSVHLLPQGLDWRPPALDEALAQADDIWFELPLDQLTDEAAIHLTQTRGRLPPGETLWEKLSPERRARVEIAANTVGVAPEILTPMRPWLADLTLSLAADAQSGARSNEGVEAALQNDARPTARRHAFETVGEQIGFLAGGSETEQLLSLDETIRELTQDPDLYDRSVREWMTGDLTALQHDDLDTLRSAAPSAYERLIVNRNRRWARVLAGLVRKPGVTVVVVGAGHLIGPQGVPALLRARGFAVEGP